MLSVTQDGPLRCCLMGSSLTSTNPSSLAGPMVGAGTAVPEGLGSKLRQRLLAGSAHCYFLCGEGGGLRGCDGCDGGSCWPGGRCLFTSRQHKEA